MVFKGQLLTCAVIGVLLAGVMTGCNQFSTTDFSEPANKTEFPETETSFPSQEKISIEPDTSSFGGWYRYTSWDYGFSFAFPSDWEVTKERGHFLFISPDKYPEISLLIGSRSAEEPVTIQRSGLSAGKLSLAGEVSFLGQTIEKHILEYEGKNKAILYNQSLEISINHLAITLSLNDTVQTDYDAVEIPIEVENTADEIVQSFALVE